MAKKTTAYKAWGVLSREGNLSAWSGCHRYRDDAWAQAALGMMGASDYDDMNEAQRKDYLKKSGVKVVRVTVSLLPTPPTGGEE